MCLFRSVLLIPFTSGKPGKRNCRVCIYPLTWTKPTCSGCETKTIGGCWRVTNPSWRINLGLPAEGIGFFQPSFKRLFLKDRAGETHTEFCSVFLHAWTQLWSLLRTQKRKPWYVPSAASNLSLLKLGLHYALQSHIEIQEFNSEILQTAILKSFAFRTPLRPLCRFIFQRDSRAFRILLQAADLRIDSRG